MTRPAFILVHDHSNEFTINVDHIIFIDPRGRSGGLYPHNAEIHFKNRDKDTNNYFPNRISVMESPEQLREMINAERELMRQLEKAATK